MMLAAEGYVPEVARSLMLRGAEIILWAAMPRDCRWTSSPARAPRRTASSSPVPARRPRTAPRSSPTRTAATLAMALEGRELAVGAEVNRALAHVKERAPGTDVVRNRQPATLHRDHTRAAQSAHEGLIYSANSAVIRGRSSRPMS